MLGTRSFVKLTAFPELGGKLKLRVTVSVECDLQVTK